MFIGFDFRNILKMNRHRINCNSLCHFCIDTPNHTGYLPVFPSNPKGKIILIGAGNIVSNGGNDMVFLCHTPVVRQVVQDEEPAVKLFLLAFIKLSFVRIDYIF